MLKISNSNKLCFGFHTKLFFFNKNDQPDNGLDEGVFLNNELVTLHNPNNYLLQPIVLRIMRLYEVEMQ